MELVFGEWQKVCLVGRMTVKIIFNIYALKKFTFPRGHFSFLSSPIDLIVMAVVVAMTID